jgi:hypothetical protein
MKQSESAPMSITRFLDGQGFDPEIKRIMGVAFELVLATLQLADRNVLANEVVANRIIALAKTGESDPNLMCNAVLKVSGAAFLNGSPPH